MKVLAIRFHEDGGGFDIFSSVADYETHENRDVYSNIVLGTDFEVLDGDADLNDYRENDDASRVGRLNEL